MLTKADLQARIAKAIVFMQGTREPHALLFMNMIHRRFGIEVFADTLERFDAVLAERPEQAPVLRVLRRIADADNPLQPDDWDHVDIQTDRVLVSALYCDRLGLPPFFPDVLGRAVSQGGYALTHALLAWIWIQENGCQLDLADGFVEEMYSAVAAIIDNEPAMTNDLKLEAAAFLCLARQSARVDPRFVQRVIAIQNPDGGWGRPEEVDPAKPDQSSWHSSVLALLLLLHIDIPES
jgi:hypothetical protein